VIGANLNTIGVAVSAGADYFLTANLAVGGMLGLDLSTTLGERPAFYGTFEVLAVASWSFNAPDGAPRIKPTAAAEETPAAPMPELEPALAEPPAKKKR